MTKRFSLGVAMGAVLLLPVLVAPSSAETAAELACRRIDGGSEASNNDVSRCLKPVLNYYSLISVSNAVRRVVSGRLAEGSEETPEPAGLFLDGDGDIAARLERQGRISVEPTADVPAVTEPRRFNVWIDGKYSWIEGKNDIDESEGPLRNVMVGIDYRILSNVVLGLLGTYEISRLETGGGLPIQQNTKGFGGGAYVGVTITPNIVFSGLATYAAINTDFDLTNTGHTDSDRIQLSGAFTGYWYFGTTRLSPSVTLAWSKEWQDEYSDGFTPAQRFESGVLSGGSVVGHTFALSNSFSVEPYAGAFIDYTFLNETHTDGLGSDEFEEQADLRLQGGVNLTLSSNVQLMLQGEWSGLLVDEAETYAGEANLAIQF